MNQPLTVVKMHHHLHQLKVQLKKDFKNSIFDALQEFRIQFKKQILEEIHSSSCCNVNKELGKHQLERERNSTVDQSKMLELESKIAFLQKSLESLPKGCPCLDKLQTIERDIRTNRQTYNNQIASLLQRPHKGQLWSIFHSHFKLDQSLLNTNSKNISKFSIKQSLVQIKHNNGSCYQLLGRIPIQEKPVNCFSIKKTLKRWILLGIISEKYLNDENSYQSERKQCIFYLIEGGAIGRRGKIHGGCKQSKEGEVIMMSVFKDKIVWSVDREIRATLEDPMIADVSIPWVPFIAMQHQGDQISWE